MRFVAALLALCCLGAVGPQSTEVALFWFPDRTEQYCTTAYAGDVVYNQYGSWLLAESRGREWLTGSAVWGPYTLPHPVEYYCKCPCPSAQNPECLTPVCPTSGTITACNTQILYGDASPLLPFNVADRSLTVLVYDGIVGGFGGGKVITTGCPNPLCPGCAHLNLNTMTHEGGHAQPEVLQHSSHWSCQTEDVGPNLENLSTPGCGWSAYGDSWDPMGAANPAEHYSTYMRGRLGWLLPSNIYTINGSGDVTLRRADVDSTEIQELRVHLAWHAVYGTLEYFYTLEYRPDHGGVVVRYKGCYNNCQYAEVFMVNRHQVLTPADQFVDPYRNITISLVSQDGERATVHVHHPNGTGGGGYGGGCPGCSPPVMIPE